MQTRSGRQSILGKRPATCEAVPLTPESTPNAKRVKTTSEDFDPNANKENIPPLSLEALNATPSRTRSLRRTNTEVSSTSRSKRTPRRHASLSSMPSTPSTPAFTRETALVTPPPSPPAALLPISSKARALLRATCNNATALAGRFEESAIVRGFIDSFLSSEESTHPILYISGSPGTGKTALVNAVLRDMSTALQGSSITVVTVNCMAFNNVDALWFKLLEMFQPDLKGRQQTSCKTPRQAFEALLSEKQSKCVILLDELDHIASSSQSLSDIFNLVNSNTARVRIIGIANTHTLTSTTSSSASTRSMQSVKTVHFVPYTPQQLLDILNVRLASLAEHDVPGETKDKLLPVPSLTLLTKKIASQTGDVRALFEVLRGAIDIAVRSVVSSSSNPLEVPQPTVTPPHILAALKAYTPASSVPPPSNASPFAKAADSELVVKTRNLGLQSRIVLLAILLASKRLEASLPLLPGSSSIPSSPSKSSSTPSPSSAVEINHLHSFYSTIIGRSQGDVLTAVSRSEFSDLIGVLETVGLISQTMAGKKKTPSTPSKSGRKAVGRTSSFGSSEVSLAEGVRANEILRGLGITESAESDGDVRAEEIRAIWEKENACLARESKAITKSAILDKFNEAAED